MPSRTVGREGWEGVGGGLVPSRLRGSTGQGATLARVSSAFISSVMRDFAEFREAAARAVRRFGWSTRMAEDLSAQDRTPRGALLEEVARADVFLLMLGARYGADEGGRSPTEDEYDEALRLGKPIIVLVQEGVEREPAQEAFLGRVSAGWSGGRYRASFGSPDQLAAEIVLALRAVEADSAGGDAEAEAVARVAELTAGEGERGNAAEVGARVALAPVGLGVVVSAAELNAGTLPGALAAEIRQSALVDGLAGFESKVSAEGIRLAQVGERFYQEQTRIMVDVGGCLLSEGPVAGEGQLGGMYIDPERLRIFVVGSLALGLRVWALLGVAERVRRVAVQVSIPRAGYRSFGRPRGSSVSMGGLGRLDTVLAPERPTVVPARQLDQPGLPGELCAQIERAFRDAGAVNG